MLYRGLHLFFSPILNTMERREYATLKTERLINNYHLKNYQIEKKEEQTPPKEIKWRNK